MNNTTGGTGAVLTVTTISSGLTQWVTANSTLISLGLTAISCFGGLFFLYLNYLENRKRTAAAINQA